MDISSVFKNLPTLETERLILRKLEESDLDAIFQYCSNPEVAKHTSWEPVKTIDESRAFLKSVLDGYSEGSQQPWGIVDKETGTLIGTIGLDSYDENLKSMEFGYAMHQNFWGKGLGTEALRRIIKFGFEVLNLENVHACCVAENPSSERIMQKCGMRFEGLRKRNVAKNGVIFDMKYYGLLREEWQLQKGVQ